jgi:hypothetical protein
MRRLLIIGCVLLAGCGPQPGAEENRVNAVNNLAASPGNASGPEDIPGLSPTRAALYKLPEGTRGTDCAAADYYPGGQVPWSFYDYPAPPEFERYLECLLAEARRDGGRVRLASPGSFPRVGSCVSARIRSINPLAGEGGPSSLNGTYIVYDNGQSFGTRDEIGGIARSRVGDPVRICVAALPEGCPGFDLRGIDYRVRNLRTDESWVMGNSQHVCRGA